MCGSARTPEPAHGLRRPGPVCLVPPPRAASGPPTPTLLSHAQPGPPHGSRDQLPPGTGNAHWAAAMLLGSRDAANTSAFRRPKVPPTPPRSHALACLLQRIGHACQGSTPSSPAARFGAGVFAESEEQVVGSVSGLLPELCVERGLLETVYRGSLTQI